jgi:YVTN family beta-propeller protein
MTFASVTALAMLGVSASSAWAGTTAYVTNVQSNTVTPINVATNTAGTAITVGTHPTAVAVTPSGQTAYVTSNSNGTVTPINVATNTAGTPITVGSAPNALAVTPNGQTAYVVNFGSNTVTPINLATNTAGTAIPVGQGPEGIAITPNGQTAYVTNSTDGTVTPINLATNTAGTPITVGNEPQEIAITPNGQTAYVANQTSNTVTPITIATNTAGTAIPVNSYPDGVAITPNGQTAYVTSEGSGTVTPITIATNTAGTPITVGSGAENVAITSNGQTAYVVNTGSNSVTPITIATNTAGTPITVGNTPEGIAITASAPADSAAPSISGTAQQGQTLTASNGTWSGNPTYSYQWQDCDSSGSNCASISGATGQSYTLTGSDVGSRVRVIVTATNSGGPTPANSAATAAISATPATSTTPGTTTSTPPSTTTSATGTSPVDAVTIAPGALSAGLQATAAGQVSVPLQCPAVVVGVCAASGTLSISVNPDAAPVNANALTAHAVDQESVIAQFAGVQVQAGQQKLIATNLSPRAIAYLRAHGIYRVLVTLQLHNLLVSGQTVNSTQQVWLYVPALTGCHAATGVISSSGIGALRLGMRKGQAHRIGHYTRTRNGFEHYCVAGGKVRVAYASRALAHAQRMRAGRVVIALTSNQHYATHGIHAGMSVRAARRQLHLSKPLTIGLNAWYFIPGKKATWILKAQHGRISEIGLTAQRTAHTRAQERYLLRHL